jgi:hypothetical protein
MDEQRESTKYEAPTVRDLGTVEEMTQDLNKIGPSADSFTALTGGIVVGHPGPVVP